ncbi:hypothetical protein D3C76_1412150 [compost metagenome]
MLALEDYEHQEQIPKIKKLLSNLFSRIENINKTRNKFLHGTWHINYASQEQQDFSQAKGFKATNTANGLRLDRLEHTAESFLEAAEECLVIHGLVRDVSLCLYLKSNLLKNFDLEDNKIVRVEAGN